MQPEFRLRKKSDVTKENRTKKNHIPWWPEPGMIKKKWREGALDAPKERL